MLNLKEKNSLFGYRPNKFFIAFLIAGIFILAIAVRYYPIQHRGFPWGINSDNLILARNLHLANNYGFENKLNVVLGSASLKQEGVPAQNGSNRLTSEIYAKIFDWFGFQPNLPIFVSVFLFALTNVLLFFLVWRLFSLTVAFIFSLIDILLPIVLAGSNVAGFYEWAMLFFCLALVSYFFSFKREKESIKKADGYSSLIYLFLAGLLFGLTILTRNAFAISFVPFALFDFWQTRSFKRILALIAPVVVLAIIFLYPGYFYKESSYYLARGTEKTYDGHLFPDPYTFHFDRENFINQIKGKTYGSETNVLIAYGYADGWKIKIKETLVSLSRYVMFASRIPTFGGSVGVFLAVLGMFLLFQKKRELFKLFAVLIFVWGGSLVFLRTGNVDHFLELRFVLGVAMAAAIFGIIETINDFNSKNGLKYLLMGGVLLACLGHFAESDKWMLHENYESSYLEKQKVMEMVKEIKNNPDLTDKDVIASPGGDMAILALAYYTDRNFIFFSQETVDKLIQENKLQEAFAKFGVTYAAGFGEQNQKIGDAGRVKATPREN